MHLSVWEKESFYAHSDVIIAGSGFVGLWSAYHLKKKKPDLKITILERGVIPTGASTRNAGFACYGSATELIRDAATMGEENMLSLVDMRYSGIKRITELFSPAQIGYENKGGHELIAETDADYIQQLRSRVEWLNDILSDFFTEKPLFRFNNEKISAFGFRGINQLITTEPEAQLHSGRLCMALLQMVQSMGVLVLNATEISRVEESNSGIKVITNAGFDLSAEQLLVCTNAFARELLPGLDIIPARGQILLTAPVPGLRVRGTFHYDEGFYYFRDLGDRLLLGGARNAAIVEESTSVMDISDAIQSRLERFLFEHVLPGISVQITDRWSGIMGLGPEKMPVIKKISERSFCAVRMSGMGVALAPVAGEKVANMML